MPKAEYDEKIIYFASFEISSKLIDKFDTIL